jgi:hypothetical protein
MAIKLRTSAGARPVRLFTVTDGSESTATAQIPSVRASRGGKAGWDIVTKDLLDMPSRVYLRGNADTRKKLEKSTALRSHGRGGD